MKREEHNTIVTELLGLVTADGQARASELLETLRTDYDETLAASERAAADLVKANETVEKFRSVNTKFFLQLEQQDKEHNFNNEEQHKEQEEDKPLSFNDLFNEKGELK